MLLLSYKIIHNFLFSQESCASACGTFMSYEKSTNGGMLNLQIHAKKPKLMSELIRLCSAADHTVHLDIALLARVLGKLLNQA